jgi:hypothetical protein
MSGSERMTMESQLEPKYSIFPTVQKMLDPITLGELLERPVTRVNCQPMNGHSGLAGGQLSYVDTDAGRLVLKKMSITSDWIMKASDDKICRSVMLWQYGLLDRLRPHLDHKILACAHDGISWAILMEDLSGHVFTSDRPMPKELVLIFLDILARLHTTFWKNPNLNDPKLDLCDPARLLDQTSLPMAQNFNGSSMGVIPVWVRVGWEVMEEVIEPDVFKWMHRLIFHPQPLFRTLDRYPWTLLHGDFRADNLAYPGHPVVLDWQEATRGLMTIDLAWFTKSGFVQNGMGKMAARQYYRQRLELYLDRHFEDQEWQVMVDLGNLVDALRSTCFEAYWYKHTESQEQREIERMSIQSHTLQVRNAMRWLVSDD